MTRTMPDFEAVQQDATSMSALKHHEVHLRLAGRKIGDPNQCWSMRNDTVACIIWLATLSRGCASYWAGNEIE
jgi:hypothetical protein